MHQNLVCKSPAAARNIAKGCLDMRACDCCGFVLNVQFDRCKLSYDDDYDNTQDCSSVFSTYLDNLARHLVEDHDVRNARIVEIGCGNGAFLRRLVSREGSGNQGIGYDPSYIGPAQEFGGRLRFEKRLFDASSTDVGADVIVCRHVIEHVQQPLVLLSAVRRALASTRQARVFFETPCVEWILRNRVIWDFFYEHCSLFSAQSLRSAFETAGFLVRDVRHVFANQYLWVQASLVENVATRVWQPGEIPGLVQAYAADEQHRRRSWSDQVERLARLGRVALWGAGAKGSTFANLIDPNAERIDCVVDINPNKQGCYIPGSGHPIVGYRDLSRRRVTDVILMNSNYQEENLKLLQAAQINARLTTT